MPNQELDANEDISFRRYEESSVFEDSEGHMTITGEHESGMTSRIRVPLDDVMPEIERYAEERVAELVEEHRDEFQDFVVSSIEDRFESSQDLILEFLDQLEDDLDLSRPQGGSTDEGESETIEVEDEVSTESEAEAEATSPSI